MSAIRNSRRPSRSRTQTPYTRPPPKKSLWSITGFLSFLNPLRSQSPIEEDVSDSESREYSPESQDDEVVQGFTNTTQVSPPIREPQPAPMTPSPVSSPTDLQSFTDQIRDTVGPERLGIVINMLQQSAHKSEPFRFSSTPIREASPFQSNASGANLSFGSSAPPTSTPSPRKTLPRNPNGPYRWQGGGSAKALRSRNRFSSPAFGASRSTSDRLVLKDTQIGIETPRSDTKRRRVGDDASSSWSTSSGASSSQQNVPIAKQRESASAPDFSPAKLKHTLPFPVSAGTPVTPGPSTSNANANASPSSSRLRAPLLSHKPTVPVVPSPLRQAWSGASPSSQNSNDAATPSPPRQTKAANYMTELIKEVTPPKRPDLSNPYQTASPLGKVGPVTTRSRRTRATGKPTAPSKGGKNKETTQKPAEKEKIYSPQAIIEATLPKGSKRSRPPPHLEKSTTEVTAPLSQPVTDIIQEPTSKGLKRPAAYIVEEVDEDDPDAKPTTKKSKPHLMGRVAVTVKGTESTMHGASSSDSDILIEEVEIDNKATAEQPHPVTSHAVLSGTIRGRPGFTGVKSAPAPKEPSKLRHSHMPPPDSPVPSPPPSVSAPPQASTSLTTSSTPKPLVLEPFSSPATNKGSGTVKLPLPAKLAALAVPAHLLPVYTFTIHASVSYDDAHQHKKACNDAKSLPLSSLPTFDFTKTVGKKADHNLIPSMSPVKPFNWAAAGGEHAASANNTWTCSTCLLTNPDSATEKCTVCAALRPTPTASVPVKAFDWGAAGMKAPPTGSASTWTCSTCMLSNPASATDKCTICEALR